MSFQDLKDLALKATHILPHLELKNFDSIRDNKELFGFESLWLLSKYYYEDFAEQLYQKDLIFKSNYANNQLVLKLLFPLR